MKKPNQPSYGTNPYRVLKLLEEGEEVTGFDIINKLKILSYNRAIFDLRQRGYNIITTLFHTEEGKKYGIFELIPD
jgi:hypothetical protein